ncbi:coiled-coil domain-containing protein 115 isoform X2 [Pristis pectinata]|uniref:coiled-coil domain-containing protein 115 isoform X2 n=1 Tax=Pristis pectinata TaxID=685728 RepID=UPI00223DE77D|nr:coiled-coil domain-containing protein 115 isoform X2 [Pristis pectinata]
MGSTNRSPPLTPPSEGSTNRSPPLTPPSEGSTNRSPPLTPPSEGSTNRSPPLTPPSEGSTNRSPPLTPPSEGSTNRSPPLTPQSGWFLLSKARYSMGNKRVSALQYGPEMVPLARVDVSQEDDGHYSFRVERVDSGDVQTVGAVVDESLEMEEIGPKEWEGSPLVRRRRPRGSGEEGQKAPPADGLVGGSRASTKDGRRVAQQGATLPAQEPLNWFGILVPQSLRLAQASFKEVVKLAAEVATLHSRLASTKKQYQDLLQQKQTLVGPQEG